MRIKGCAWLVTMILLSGCWDDRPRPMPVEPDGSDGLSVELLQPLSNAVVVAGRPVQIEVSARNQGTWALAGVGYVMRQVQGGMTLDSGAVFFGARAAVRDTFDVLVPAHLTTNTHLSISAVAFRSNGEARSSVPRQVVVAQCLPEQPSCR